MSALTRIAFSTHRQIDIQPGDRVILSASAIPGNENSIGAVVNESSHRKGAEVVNERAGALHVSGHACQEELKIIHALVKPKFFIPVHGEQRHLRVHAKLAQEMGMNPRNILISDIGKVIELTHNSCRINGTVPLRQCAGGRLRRGRRGQRRPPRPQASGRGRHDRSGHHVRRGRKRRPARTSSPAASSM